MTTWVLTPDAPNPMTGFANPVIGWQLTAETALDVFEGCNTVYTAGWVAALGPLNGTGQPPTWQLVLNRAPLNVTISYGDWFVFDGLNVWDIPADTVTAEYTVTQQPAPPQAKPTEPEHAAEHEADDDTP